LFENRASSTSVVIARSSVSKTARPSPSSSNARILVALPGPSFSEDNTRRVSLRYDSLTSTQFDGRHVKDERLMKSPVQEVAKKRSRRTVKSQRAIVGASLDVIKERRSQRPEARSAARAAAIKEGKEKRAAAQSAKKAEKAKSAASASKGQASRLTSKQGAKGAPKKVQATSR
jgi:hypothetical protein